MLKDHQYNTHRFYFYQQYVHCNDYTSLLRLIEASELAILYFRIRSIVTINIYSRLWIIADKTFTIFITDSTDLPVLIRKDRICRYIIALYFASDYQLRDAVIINIGNTELCL